MSLNYSFQPVNMLKVVSLLEKRTITGGLDIDVEQENLKLKALVSRLSVMTELQARQEAYILFEKAQTKPLRFGRPQPMKKSLVLNVGIACRMFVGSLETIQEASSGHNMLMSWKIYGSYGKHPQNAIWLYILRHSS